jgi:hypothetical protein
MEPRMSLTPEEKRRRREIAGRAAAYRMHAAGLTNIEPARQAAMARFATKDELREHMHHLASLSAKARQARAPKAKEDRRQAAYDAAEAVGLGHLVPEEETHD